MGNKIIIQGIDINKGPNDCYTIITYYIKDNSNCSIYTHGIKLDMLSKTIDETISKIYKGEL